MLRTCGFRMINYYRIWLCSLDYVQFACWFSMCVVHIRIMNSCKNCVYTQQMSSEMMGEFTLIQFQFRVVSTHIWIFFRFIFFIVIMISAKYGQMRL